MSRFHFHPLRRLLLPILFTLLLLTGCHGNDADLVPDQQSGRQIEEENAHNTFSRLTNDIFMQEVTSDSITLHYTAASPSALGIKHQEPTLGHTGTVHQQSGVETSARYLELLEQIPYDALSKKDKVTYDILKWQFKLTCDSADFTCFSEPVSPTTGIQAQLPILLAEYEFRCPADIEDYLLLLQQLPDYYKELAAYEKEKAQAGLFMSAHALESVTRQCQDFLCDVDNHYLNTTFRQKIDALEWLSNEQKSRFKELNTAALTSYVYPAYEELTASLNTLKDTCTNQEGLCHFPEGKEYYTWLVRSSTGSESTPEELISRVQKQMSEDLNTMSGMIDNNPDTLEKLHNLEVSITTPDAILEHMRNAISDQFPAPPDVSCTVKYVDESLQEHLSPAFYLTPPLDRISENVIYINEPSFRDDVQLFTTLAHEGYPGHLYQNVFFSATAPDKIRSILSFPGYAEGYATYAEHLSYHYMGFDNDTASILQLSSSVTLGIYASLDLGIHYEGWSFEKAKDYLHRYGIQREETVSEIYYAIIAEPANYLKYYVGCMEFTTLRRQAEDAWGDDFSPKRFHQYILEMGDAPFDVLQKYLT